MVKCLCMQMILLYLMQKNVSFTMQPETDLISDWMTSIMLTTNIDKCEVL